MRVTSAGAVSGTQPERRMSIYTVAGHEFGSVHVMLLIQPVTIDTVSRAESVSVYPMGRAELVSVYTVSRIKSVPVYSVSRTEPVSLYTVSWTESAWGRSVDALRGAEADHWPRGASRPKRSVAYGGQSSWNLQQRAASTGAQR